MKYIDIAFLIGICSGVVHNIILFRHVMPYMRRRGFEPRGPFEVSQFNRAVTEYHTH